MERQPNVLRLALKFASQRERKKERKKKGTNASDVLPDRKEVKRPVGDSERKARKVKRV